MNRELSGQKLSDAKFPCCRAGVGSLFRVTPLGYLNVLLAGCFR
jgi:hypothetical protein